MLPKSNRPLYKVRHDGVSSDHPDTGLVKLFGGKKNVTNQVTKYKQSAEKTADMLKKKGFKNVRIEETTMAMLNFSQLRVSLEEKTLTPAEKKKREEVAKAIEREHPGMDKSMKMAIATSTAKRVAEENISEEEYDTIRDKYGKSAARGMMNSRWNPQHPQYYGKRSSTSSSSSSSDKHYHKVPFAQKDDAKKEGMRWDSGAKKWYHSTASASKASKFQREEVEVVSELKKSTLGSYVKKASWDAAVKAAAGRTEPGKGHTTKSVNRLDGIAKATDRLTKEEIEQIDELKKTTLGSYVKKANKQVADNAWKAGTAGAPDLYQQGKLRAKAYFKAKRRMAGIDKATDRLTKEETEQIDELKKSTLASYTNKVVDPVYGMPRSTKKIKQRLAGLQRAHQRAIGKKPTSEETEKEQIDQVDELSTAMLAKYKTAAAASAKAADKAGNFELGHKRFKGMLKATSKQFKNIEAGKK